MSFYTLVLFAHMLGAFGLFVVVSFQWISIIRLRRARTVEQVREWSSLSGGTERVEQVSGLLALGAGIYMATVIEAWRAAWVLVSLVTFLTIATLAAVVNIRRLKAIQATGREADTAAHLIPTELLRQINDPVLWTAVHTTAFMLLGIVFLMTNKPDLVGALTTIAVSIVLGVASAQLWRPRGGALAAWRAEQSQEAGSAN